MPQRGQPSGTLAPEAVQGTLVFLPDEAVRFGALDATVVFDDSVPFGRVPTGCTRPTGQLKLDSESLRLLQVEKIIEVKIMQDEMPEACPTRNRGLFTFTRQILMALETAMNIEPCSPFVWWPI